MKLKTIFKKKYAFAAVAALLAVALLAGGWLYSRSAVADEYYISSSASFRLVSFPVTVGVGEKAVTASAGTEEYGGTAKLFGFIPLKTVKLTLVSEKRVIAGGEAFGLKMYTNGLMVVGFSDISTASGPKNPALTAGIEKGDILKTVDGEELNKNSDFAELINSKAGSAAEIVLERDGRERTLTLLPVLSADDGKYKAGMWVRDSAAGIGTMSFYDPDTLMFTGLGHGIYDVDTGALLPVRSGEIVKTTITSVKKGEKGAPGELRGVFEQDSVIGDLYGNTELGVFGSISAESISGESLPIALKQEIRTGGAKIIMPAVNGGTAEYGIEIVSIANDDGGKGRNMIIEITDEKLLELTGGIVQGMSGSPIIQNGKLIGAVTHVLVNDPTRGYAIFAERMYDLID